MISPVSMASVSSVRFCAGPEADLLSREGAYSKQPAQPEMPAAPAEEKKKTSFGKKVLYTVLGLAVAAASLAALTRFKVLNALPKADLDAAKWYQPKVVCHYLATAGEAVAKYCYDVPVKYVKGLFSGGKGKKLVEEVADAAGTAA